MRFGFAETRCVRLTVAPMAFDWFSARCVMTASWNTSAKIGFTIGKCPFADANLLMMLHHELGRNLE